MARDVTRQQYRTRVRNLDVMRLRTALNDLLDVRIPLLNAPMTPQAGGALARAVSDAGAFGMLGFDEDEDDDAIRAQISMLQGANIRPFGIGLVAWVLERRPALLDIAIAAKPRLVSISFGNPAPYVPALHAAGIFVASQVQSRRWAEIALDARVDLLVVQGSEAGGHTGSVATLPLLQIVAEMTQTPIVAAGGIATGAGLAAVIAGGAVGGWVGTPFLLAAEARSNPQARERIAASRETDTVLTSVYDRVQSKPWPAEFRGRALRNAFVDRWHGHEDELTLSTEARANFANAKARKDYTTANLYAGQSVGMIHRVRSAAEIVADIESGAIEYFRRCASYVIE